MFVSGSVLFALHAEISTGLCYRGNVLLVSFRESALLFFTYFLHLFTMLMMYIWASWIGRGWEREQFKA